MLHLGLEIACKEIGDIVVKNGEVRRRLLILG